MSAYETFLESAKKHIEWSWTKTINPFDKERPRVGKYPVSMTCIVNAEIDGEIKSFTVKIEEVSEATKKRAEEWLKAPQPPLPPEMVERIKAEIAD